MQMLKKLYKVALVTDKAWLEALGKIENVVLPNLLIKTYDLTETEDAKTWLLN